MNITLREMGDELKKLNRIVVTGHVNPDGDAVGSALALAAILKQLGKDVRVVFNDDMPRNFSILPYRSEIEKPPANGEKIPADALVIVDASPDRIGRVLECVDAPILNIDHHVSNDGEGRKLYCDPDSAATAEIIFKLGMDLNVELTKEIAACIYVGIATDSGFFCYSNTTPRTLWIASKLRDADAVYRMASYLGGLGDDLEFEYGVQCGVVGDLLIPPDAILRFTGAELELART